MKHVIFYFLFIILLDPIKLHAQCPADTSFDKLPCADKTEKLIGSIGRVSDECLGRALSDIAECGSKSEFETVAAKLRQSGKSAHVGNRVLITAFFNEKVHQNQPLWSSVLYAWKQSHRTPYEEFYNLVNDGKPLEADSLFRVFDGERMIGNVELLRWTNVKIITGDLASVAQLYCRIFPSSGQSEQDSAAALRMHAFITGQFISQMEGLSKENAARVCESFKKCVLEKAGVDSLQAGRLLAETYARIGMFEKQIEVLVSMGTDKSELLPELIDIARERFFLRNYVAALHAAKKAIALSDQKQFQADAATIVYQSFMALGLNDSAFNWLKRADITNDKRRIEAVTLYQNAGQLRYASEYIEKITPSLAKDTLALRQVLLSNDREKAVKQIESLKFLRGMESEYLLWKVRVLLFNNKCDSIPYLFDSLRVPSDFHGASELILCRYWLQRLQDCPDVLAKWAEIEYLIFAGMLEKSVPLIQNNTIDVQCRWRLALRVARSFYDQGKLNDALSVVSTFDEKSVSPEFLYYKALFLSEKGDVAKARLLLEQIVLDFSTDIFSGKARLLLSKMTK